MADYIDREGFLHDIYCLFDIENFLSLNKSMITQIVNRQPVIEAEPVVHAKWIKVDDESCKCSNCGLWDMYVDMYGMGTYEEYIEEHKHCYRCGARMDGDSNV